MSVVYDKYTEKSFVVRGKLMDNLQKRKETSKQFNGACIWNTRLKGGPGLLVPINDENIKTLQRLCDGSGKEPVRDTDEKNDSRETRDTRDTRETRDTKDIKDVEIEDVTHEEVDKKKDISREEDDKEDHELPQRRSSYRRKDDDFYSESESPRRSRSRDYSDTDEEKTPVKSPRKNSKPTKKKYDTESESDDYTPPKRVPSRSRDKYSSSSTSRGSKKSRRSHSVSSTNDSSEDERIQYSIRRKGQYKDTHDEELNTQIDSDAEDVTSLSRRMRYLQRKIRNLEDKLYSKKY